MKTALAYILMLIALVFALNNIYVTTPEKLKNLASTTDDTQGRTESPTFEIVEMTITHYDAGECCCGKWADGLTASGVPAVGNIVAADTDYYSFGTKMTIDGVEYTVEDRGGAIKGPQRIDILCKTHAEALDRGVIYRTVKVERD